MSIDVKTNLNLEVVTEELPWENMNVSDVFEQEDEGYDSDLPTDDESEESEESEGTIYEGKPDEKYIKISNSIPKTTVYPYEIEDLNVIEL